MEFRRAVKQAKRLRLGLIGPSGTGKTYSALAIAEGLGGRIALVDTEHSSASLYADRWEFDAVELVDHDPRRYIEAIETADRAGYDVLIIDSLSHAWSGRGGALELVDAAAKRSKSANTFAAWRDVTPLHNKLVDAILGSRAHVIATMRSKTAYEIQEDSRGRKVPTKIGLAPIQRDGMEYELDLVGELNHAHELIISKTRWSDIADAIIDRPGRELGQRLKAWLEGGAPVPLSSAPPSEAKEAARKEYVAAMDKLWRLRRELGGQLFSEIVGCDPEVVDDRKRWGIRDLEDARKKLDACERAANDLAAE
jgi:hypothetical protein